MQLGDDDALGAVDDERAAHGHEGDFAHVHALLFGTLLVLELKGDVEGGAVGFCLVDGFEGGELGVADFVHHEIEGHLLIVAGDGEDFAENRLQAEVLALGGEDVFLEKLLV